jgi:Mrp family chromosome partitioning ATPase
MSSMFRALERAETEGMTGNGNVVGPLRVGRGHNGHSHVRDADYDRLRVTLTLAGADVRRILLVSARPREGVSTVTVRLAAAMSDGATQGTLLVEAHGGPPTLAARVGATARVGLAEVLAKEVSAADAIVPTASSRLSLLVRGRTPIDLTHSRWLHLFDETMADLQAEYDYCLLDGGSLHSSPESLLLASHVDGTVLVVEAERTGIDVARKATGQLQRAGARLLGVVLNRRRDYVPGFLAKRL